MQDTDRSDADEALLEALFTRAPAGLFVLDPDLRVIRFNAAARGMRGLTDDRVLGRTIEEFAPAFPAAELNDLARTCLEAGTSVRRHKVRAPGRTTTPH
ncbi:hypothetical protein GCM10025734_75960 [Kitasatospora paranensis]|uniref:PAS domain-containing protein n=1 Tax=Kitasatospora paranensis TaxID=258053 RepID=UPI0031EEEE92